MDVRYLELSDGEMPVARYVVEVGSERGAIIMKRLELLLALEPGDTLPDPPVSAMFGVDGLFQFLVDYESEVHRVVFCAWRGSWILIDAFRCDDDHVIPAADRDRVLETLKSLDKS